MRRITAALAALATALGLALVIAPAANADWNGATPTNGSTIRGGSITLSASGGFDDSTLDHCSWFGGDGGSTRFRLITNPGNSIVFEQFWNTGGSRSTTIDTRNYANGNYILRNIEEVRKNGGFAGLGCSTQTNTYDRNVTIDNFVTPTYVGATSAPRNTTIPVSSTVTDATTGNAVAGLTVTWSLTGGGSVTATTNGSGVASATLPVQGSPRTATLTVGTTTTSFWRGTSITRSFEVTKNDTATTLAQPATIVHGQFTSFTANVAALNGTGTPSGTVQFTVDGNNFGAPVAVGAGGVATSSSTDALSTGNHTIGAIYSGDSGFNGSSASTKTLTINKATTTTQLNAAPTPTKYGQAVTFTATVGVVAPGVGTPTGGVQFNINGQPFGVAVPLSGNTAQLTVSTLVAGNHDVEAVYNGDADFTSSSSAVVTHGVERADTNLSLATSDATAVSGQPLSYTATVTSVAPGQGVPQGTVQFEVDGQPLGAPVALVNGQATSPSTSMLVGSHNVTANYSGNANFAGSDNSYTQVVTPANADIVLTSSQNPSVSGQSVTFRAEVAPQAPSTGDPTGSIRFRIDGVTVATPDMVDGAAELTLSNLAVGSHTVVARYLSDTPEYLSGAEDSLTQQVNKAATSTALASSSSTSVYGQPVTFTATVSVNAPGSGAPTGPVEFKDGNTVLATVPLGSDFKATFTTGGLSVGQHAITASYAGDDSFLASSGSATQTVQKASTSTVVTSSNNPALTGQSTVFTAAITPVAPGAGTITGTVLFTVNGLPIGGQRPIVNGVATSPAFSALTPGNYKVKAQYSGDGNFFKSDGLLDQGSGQSTNKGASTLELNGPATVNYNGAATFSVSVKAVAPATGKPSGVVRFWEGGVLLGSVGLEPGGTNEGTASFVTTSLTPGAHSIRAEYVGNYNFSGSEATTSVSVNRAPTSVGVSSSANPATYGQTVTLTATVSEQLPTAGAPTGTVTFKDGAAVLGTGTISTVGGQQVATLSVPGLHGGAHDITAQYAGDASFSGSTSPVYVQQVNQQGVILKAGSPLSGPQYIDTRTGYVRARLTDASGSPLVGQVITFRNEPFQTRPAYVLCTAVTDATGLAECDHTAINIDPSLSGDDLLIDVNGRYSATFGGNGDYLAAVAQGSTF